MLGQTGSLHGALAHHRSHRGSCLCPGSCTSRSAGTSLIVILGIFLIINIFRLNGWLDLTFYGNYKHETKSSTWKLCKVQTGTINLPIWMWGQPYIWLSFQTNIIQSAAFSCGHSLPRQSVQKQYGEQNYSFLTPRVAHCTVWYIHPLEKLFRLEICIIITKTALFNMVTFKNA